MLEVERPTAKLIEMKELSPTVRLLVLKCLADRPFTWLPGQYIILFSKRHPSASLPYSIASAPDPERESVFELAVSPSTTTELLDDLSLGVEFWVSGPHGKFTRQPTNPHSALFVGSGTGVTPLRAMLQGALRHASSDPAPGDPRFTLLLGCRSERELIFTEELEGLSRRFPQFRFVSTLSQPDAEWRGQRGYVQQHFGGLLQELSQPEVYVCGSSAMVKDCVMELERLGQDRSRIFTESY